MNEQILQEISEFCRARGLAESTFVAAPSMTVSSPAVCATAVASRRYADRIRAFMAHNSDGAPARRRVLFERRRWRSASGEAVARRSLGMSVRTRTQFPFLRQSAEVLLFVNTLGEMESRHARAPKSPTFIRARPRCACSTPASRWHRARARDAFDARPLPTTPFYMSARRSVSRISPDTAQDGGSFHRASVDGAGAHQSRLRGSAWLRSNR